MTTIKARIEKMIRELIFFRRATSIPGSFSPQWGQVFAEIATSLEQVRQGLMLLLVTFVSSEFRQSFSLLCLSELSILVFSVWQSSQRVAKFATSFVPPFINARL